MAFFQTACILVLISGGAFAAAEFSYNAQNLWPGVCVQGNEMQQSPINIVLGDVVKNQNLIDLDLNDWDVEYEGTFSNTGHNVQFDPSTPGLATTRNHLGMYELQQFHMHWGNGTDQGSEHRINGEQAELEIHFVHVKQGETNTNTRDYYTVVSILGDVNFTAPISGPWAKLNPMAVQSFNTSILVSDFRFDQLLPYNLDYWYYEGSLTTPDCSETVVWFVLKERIAVPEAYLQLLRELKEDGMGIVPLTFNFRMEQAIGDRVVSEHNESGASTESTESTESGASRMTPIIGVLALAQVVTMMLT
jgi:carbonic anhydrase